MLTTPPQIAGYQLAEILHQTASTAVYQAIRELDSLPVIIKLLQAEYPTLKEIERLKHEYEIARDLNLPGAIKPYDLVNYKNGLALILEDFGGQSLKKIITYGKVEIIDFLFLAIRIAEILGDLHTNQIIHKDIKPQNIIYNPKTLEVKITDFSIAARLSRGTKCLSTANSLEGTLAYISPEQTGRTNRAIDYRTDLYSLGVTFYEILTNQLPCPYNDPLELVHCHIAKTPPLINQINPEIPAVIAGLVAKLLAKTPEDRYQSAYGLKADLEECLMQLHSLGKIDNFPLGKQDKSGQFQLPEKLYNREAEITELTNIFKRVQAGSIEVLLIEGNPGTGKSLLAKEVERSLVRQQGYFITGKCDRGGDQIPYFPLIQAFQELIQQLLIASQEQINVWQEKLLTVLGNRGQVIIDLIPELELIIGKQQPSPEPSSFKEVFKKFILALTDTECPLVLFLDDLEEIDSNSLELVQFLVANTPSQHLLILGASSENELIVNRELVQAIAQWQSANIKVNKITLENLDLEQINQLVADTLGESPRKTVPIADLILEKTQGNPFLAIQLLKSLDQDKILTFNFRSGRWQWDVEELAKIKVADDVVEIAIAKIQKLSKTTQYLLQLAAVLDDKFNFNTLAIISEQSPQIIATELQLAIEKELILPLNDRQLIIPPEEILYQFASPRIQQAVYNLIPEAKKNPLHWQIGQLLFKNSSPSVLEENIFEIVKHLNISMELLNSQSAKEELAELNLLAGKKAKSVHAGETALTYLNIGLGLLSNSSWLANYQLTFALHLETIGCEYLLGNFERATSLAAMTLKQINSDEDKFKVNQIQFRHYQNTGCYTEAIQLGLQSLKWRGLELAAVPIQGDLSTAALAVQQNLNEREIADLINVAESSESQLFATISLLADLILPAYLTSENLGILCILEMMNLGWQYGDRSWAALAYTWYCSLLVSDRHPVWLPLANLKSPLQNFPLTDCRIEAQIRTLSSTLIDYWQQPIKTNISLQRAAYQALKESGDFSWCHYSAIGIFWQKLIVSDDLARLAQKYQQYIDFAKETDLTAALTLMLQRQLILQLAENPANHGNHSETYFDPEAALATFQSKQYFLGSNNYYLTQLVIFYLDEKYQDAAEMADAFEQAIAADFQVTFHCFYQGLISVALYLQTQDHEQTSYWENFQTCRQKLQTWAEHCPENFLANYLLIEAEAAQINEKYWQAVDLYDRAIAAAKENKSIFLEALSNELAAKFYLRLNKPKIAKSYLRDAHYIYLKWGAAAQAQKLETKYPQLLTLPVIAEVKNDQLGMISISTTTTTGSISGILDWSTVVKASIAISGEILLENLLRKLLKITLESAGAKMGLFLTKKQQQWMIEAEATIDSTEVKVSQSLPIENSGLVPVSIIYYVERTQQNVVLDDATQSEIFASDPYIIEHQPKSVLCFPIIHQAKITGILYLENPLTVGAFTSDRIEILKVLSSQVAISIENALLYNHLQSYSQELEIKNAALKESETRERAKAQELAQSLNQLQQTQSQLIQTEKISNLGQLVAGVAHEVNNPIGFISGNIDRANEYVQDLTDLLALYQKNYPQPAREILDKAEDIELEYVLEDLPNTISSMKMGADRIREIMSSLRNFSRADSTQKHLADIHQGIDSTLIILRYRLKAKSERPAINIIKEYGDLPLVECYAGQLNQVFMNLIANAIDALDESNVGHSYREIEANPNAIAIRTSVINLAEQNFAEIRIADNGPGITPEVQQHLFDAFFTTKPEGKGTGLGLSISYQIITEKHGGQMQCVSTPGKGAEFIIQIPL